MSKIEVDISAYISEREKREIAISTFRAECVSSFKDEEAVQRILSNAAYHIVYKMVDEQFDVNLEKLLTETVTNLIKNMTTYNLFNKPDAWSRETNHAYDIMQKAVTDNKELIYETVKQQMPDSIMKSIKLDLKDYIQESVNRHYDGIK